LVRCEPFSSLHIQMQDGHFDYPDRLFNSVQSTWKMCTTNLSEVKELTPEFYSNPHFLTNHNDFHFGSTQEKRQVGDVILPPWAHNDPEIFIAKMREALESDYVSACLHGWIDLIFGYKQRGPDAVAAANVFYYLTYPGTVDIEDIKDPAIRAATILQIAHFGQCPMQILSRPHPRRGKIPIHSPLATTTAVERFETLRFENHKNYELLDCTESVNSGNAVIAWSESRKVMACSGIESGCVDLVFFNVQDTSSVHKVTGKSSQLVQSGSKNSLVLSSHSVMATLRAHHAKVTCMALDDNILITGSDDSTLKLWKVFIDIDGENLSSDERVSGGIEMKSFLCLYGHLSPVTNVAFTSKFELVASTSKERCLVHCLSTGELVHCSSLDLAGNRTVRGLKLCKYTGGFEYVYD